MNATRIGRWHCRQCRRVLGWLQANRMNLRLSRGGGGEYLVGFPITCVCRECKTLNEIKDGRSAGGEDAQPVLEEASDGHP